MEKKVLAYKIMSEYDGQCSYATLRTDGRYHVSKFISYSKESCEEIGYEQVYDLSGIEIHPTDMSISEVPLAK